MPRRDPVVAAFTRTRLAQVFRESGETMQRFAARVGISTPALSRMLSGTRTPGRDSIERIARAESKSPAWFYPPSSGYALDLDFLRADDPELDAAVRALRADPLHSDALKRVFRAAALALAELSGKAAPGRSALPAGPATPTATATPRDAPDQNTRNAPPLVSGAASSAPRARARHRSQK